MLRFLLIFVSCALAKVNGVNIEKFHVRLMKAVEGDCGQKHGIDLLKPMQSKSAADLDTFKLYFDCLSTDNNFFKNGEYNPSGVETMLKEKFLLGEELAKNFSKCSNRTVPTDTGEVFGCLFSSVIWRTLSAVTEIDRVVEDRCNAQYGVAERFNWKKIDENVVTESTKCAIKCNVLVQFDTYDGLFQKGGFLHFYAIVFGLGNSNLTDLLESCGMIDEETSCDSAFNTALCMDRTFNGITYQEFAIKTPT